MSGTLRAVSARVPAPSRLRRSSAVALAILVLVVPSAQAQDVGAQTARTTAPAWVAVGTQLSYDVGQATLQGGVYELIDPNWARFATRATVTMLSPVEAAGEGVVSGAGSYWYDPAALAAMTQGQVLDSDPVTGQTVTVSRVVQGSTGPVVVIGMALDGVQGESAWDVATGVMLAQSQSTQANGISTQVELQSMP